jgi:site-specific DNA recombinase
MKLYDQETIARQRETLRAVIYARYSSDNQRVQSIDEQIREITEWTAPRGYTIVDTYCDKAITGSLREREQFQKLLGDSGKNLFDVVLVFDYTRFSRGGEFGLADEAILTRNGVLLKSITEECGDDFAGKLVKHVKFLSAAEDLVKLKVNVARGQKENAVSCMHNGGTPPIGYDIDKETLKYIINEREAGAVRIIFSMFADGYEYSKIIARLNAEGYKTKRNNAEFKKNSIHSILMNRKYLGIYEWGKIKRGKPKDQDHKSSIIQAEPMQIEGGIPAIIDKELWDRAHANMKKREPSKRAKVSYMLRNKIICGLCGNRFIGAARGAAAKSENYYICSARSNEKGCKNRAIKKQTLENAVLYMIKEDLFSEQGVDWVISELEEYNAKLKSKVSPEEKARILKEITRLETKQERVKTAYYDGAIDLAEFKSQKKSIEHDISFLKDEMKEYAPTPIDREDIRRRIDEAKELLPNDEVLLQTLVEKIIITNVLAEVHLFSLYGLA